MPPTRRAQAECGGAGGGTAVVVCNGVARREPNTEPVPTQSGDHRQSDGRTALVPNGAGRAALPGRPAYSNRSSREASASSLGSAGNRRPADGHGLPDRRRSRAAWPPGQLRRYLITVLLVYRLVGLGRRRGKHHDVRFPRPSSRAGGSTADEHGRCGAAQWSGDDGHLGQ